MQVIILMIHVLVAFSLIVLVLLQHGKGASIGAAFGSGASQTVFGSQGSTSFLVKITSVLAAAFFMTSIALNYIATQEYKKDPLQNLSAQVQEVTQKTEESLNQVPTQIIPKNQSTKKKPRSKFSKERQSMRKY